MKMKRYSVPFAKIDEDEDFKQLAINTGGQLEAGNTTIRCSGTIANGLIRRWHLDAGLHLRMCDLIFAQPVELHKEAVPLHIANTSYNLLCILTPDSVKLTSINHHQQVHKTGDTILVLSPNNVDIILQIAGGSPVQLIDFQIAPYWFRDQPAYVQVLKYFEERASHPNQLPAMVERCTKKVGEHAVQLFNSGLTGSDISELFIPSEHLVTDFLETLTKNESEKTDGNVARYYEKVIEAEEILITYLHSSLPRLDNVAQQVALSESTLKRYFKLVFGKSIYEYYLNKKMEEAHRLLLEKPLSVNEAARLMGYEKVSNFIDIFKKRHGCSPGTIRKKNSAANDTEHPETLIA